MPRRYIRTFLCGFFIASLIRYLTNVKKKKRESYIALRHLASLAITRSFSALYTRVRLA
jgi:ABC-type Mn2+/Zn2+ transport system permease subunit